jgi:hypothetical protein
MESLMIYLLIGTMWSLIFEFGINTREVDNGTRFRQIMLWPIPLTAFIIGFIVAFIKSF